MAKYSPDNIKTRSLDEIKSQAFKLKAELEAQDHRSKEGQWNLRCLGIIRAELKRRNIDPAEVLGLTSDPSPFLFNGGVPSVQSSPPTSGSAPSSGITIRLSGRAANTLMKEIDALNLGEETNPGLSALEKDLEQKLDELLDSL